MERLFVYGTLRKGGIYHYLLADAKLIALNQRINGFQMFNCGFHPCAIINPDYEILGEIYEVSMELILKILDPYEGVDLGLFYRYYDKKRDFHIYLMTKENASVYTEVPCGDWHEFNENMKQVS